MVFPDGSGDVLRLYRPDILPVHGPKDAETRDVFELRSVDARISHLRAGSRWSSIARCESVTRMRLTKFGRLVQQQQKCERSKSQTAQTNRECHASADEPALMVFVPLSSTSWMR